jgi:hypothetical protein
VKRFVSLLYVFLARTTGRSLETPCRVDMHLEDGFAWVHRAMRSGS